MRRRFLGGRPLGGALAGFLRAIRSLGMCGKCKLDLLRPFVPLLACIKLGNERLDLRDRLVIELVPCLVPAANVGDLSAVLEGCTYFSSNTCAS